MIRCDRGRNDEIWGMIIALQSLNDGARDADVALWHTECAIEDDDDTDTRGLVSFILVYLCKRYEIANYLTHSHRCRTSSAVAVHQLRDRIVQV